ncbi:hypothetical protein B0H11DRAFT_2335369 [Mycena galericulata]|nr:hypothetical protein B0H11DRAFT_2335369 [Mycena galericulata]
MSLWNFTIDGNSPLFNYTPYADGSGAGLTNGWERWYSGSGFLTTVADPGVGDSYHRTSRGGASVNLEFYGTAIYLYGTTNSTYELVLDTKTVTMDEPMATGLLFSTSDLQEGTHSVSLTARPSNSAQQLAFEHAVISTPFNNMTPKEAFYDNTDTTMLKYAGDWSISHGAGIPNVSVTHPFQEMSVAGSSVAMDMGIGTVGVSLWGMMNWGHWVYMVSVDGATSYYNGSTLFQVPDAILFYQGGLDPTKNHTVTLTNVSPGMKLDLNSIRLYTIDFATNSTPTLASATDSGLTPGTTGTGPVQSPIGATHSTINAGVIAGPIVGVAVVAVLCGFFWWRNRRTHSGPPLPTHDIEPFTNRSPQPLLFPSKAYAEGRATTSPPPAPMLAPDVDRLIELIAQRININRGHADSGPIPGFTGQNPNEHAWSCMAMRVHA